MEKHDNRRTKPRVKKFLGGYLDLSYKTHGLLESMRARIADLSDAGIGLSSLTPLAPGTLVSFLDETTGETVNARVARCHKSSTGDYRIGLEREAGMGAKVDGSVDYYELLQLSPKADPDTIHRVYRILAQRYHPDNTDTGDILLFRSLLEAYGVLTDPEKRAVYDLSLHSIRRHTWKVFESPEAAQGATGERQKRRAMLWALYMKRVRDNYLPRMAVQELEDLLSIPKEHLEFTVWYLKESGLVTRTDDNKLSITVKGVDVAEALGDPAKGMTQVREDRLLEMA
jgi:curved DNA-binding protein